ncbi:MAG: hypothetical protein JW966_11580 [Anaerolineae bacterium]|nr:hypothetical protein [Anaerolineae bacterium]
MPPKTALVTLTLGAAYETCWRDVCATNWQAYADKHGFDLIAITDPLDNSPLAQNRHPAWQKCLVLSQDWSATYDRVVWIDADILINVTQSPSIVDDIPVDKVGGVECFATPTPWYVHESLTRKYDYWGQDNAVQNFTGREFHARYGLPDDINDVIQTGVMVLSPHHHRELFEHVYHHYEEKNMNAEMRPLSYELVKAGMVHWIDPRFNASWMNNIALYYPFLWNKPKYAMDVRSRFGRKINRMLGNEPEHDRLRRLCVNAAFINSFFLHFASTVPDMKLADTTLASWRDLYF